MPFIDSVSSDAEVEAEGTRLCGEQVYCSIRRTVLPASCDAAAGRI